MELVRPRLTALRLVILLLPVRMAGSSVRSTQANGTAMNVVRLINLTVRVAMKWVVMEILAMASMLIVTALRDTHGVGEFVRKRQRRLVIVAMMVLHHAIIVQVHIIIVNQITAM